ncbi:HNH endonuclease [Chroococcidiopsis sp. FACHB-1243]|nr:HNH endonuclease [Chroococcidiopsis sp. [FACHB-1243]]
MRRRFTPNQKLSILRRANYRCEIYSTPLSQENFEADHRIAYSQGGATQVWNALALCIRCNRQKSDRAYNS